MEEDINDFTINYLDQNSRALAILQEELDVNLQEQILVKKRMRVIKDSFKEIPNTDPEYALLFTQLEMDQIELDELKYREGQIKLTMKNDS